MEERQLKEVQILTPNVVSEGTIPIGATEVHNGCGKKRHDTDHLSSQRKKDVIKWNEISLCARKKQTSIFSI